MISTAWDVGRVSSHSENVFIDQADDSDAFRKTNPSGEQIHVWQNNVLVDERMRWGRGFFHISFLMQTDWLD